MFRSATIFAGLFVSLQLMAAPIAAAEAVYQWKDQTGGLHFGSTPPKGAREVKKLSSPKLSRYSSEKVLTNSGARSLLARPEPIIDPAQVQPLPAAKLTHEDVAMELDTSGAITELMVSVVNESDFEAPGVSVAFEFADGSIVPADGPLAIGAQAKAVYSILPEQLPMTVPGPATSNKNVAVQAPKVRIIQDVPTL